jgi:hypothetical protein
MAPTTLITWFRAVMIPEKCVPRPLWSTLPFFPPWQCWSCYVCIIITTSTAIACI